jgi:hypothetical protein
MLHANDLTHSIDAVFMLSDAEAPGDDHPLRCYGRVREIPNIQPSNPGAMDHGMDATTAWYSSTPSAAKVVKIPPRLVLYFKVAEAV